MPESIPKIYENLSEQERLEADHNLVGFFGLLMKIDQRNKVKEKDNENNGSANSPDQAK